MHIKGQKISKAIYGVLNSSEQQTKIIILRTCSIQDKFFRSFFGRIEFIIIFAFEIYWPLSRPKGKRKPKLQTHGIKSILSLYFIEFFIHKIFRNNFQQSERTSPLINLAEAECFVFFSIFPCCIINIKGKPTLQNW